MSEKWSLFIDKSKLKQFSDECVRCETCVETCCTYSVTDDMKMSPMGRLEILAGFYEAGEIEDADLEALYRCTECGRCDTVCTADIPISGVIADSKVALAEAGKGPLEGHRNMIRSIFEKGNAANGKSENRLDWIPETFRDKVLFEDAPVDTLLYVGCLSSFVDKETAAASLEILTRAGVPFKLMRDEFCCGIYPYNAGKLEDAEKIFTEMARRFRAYGVKKMIVPCAGCHRAFSSYYKRLLGDFDVEVIHISVVIDELIREGRLKPSGAGDRILYHDACKTGRKAGIYESPRQVLEACGYALEESSENRESASCCGSGAGVRSIDRGLSLAIGKALLAGTESDKIVSTCPFCIFNFNYSSHKGKLGKKAVHIAVAVRDSL